jgi:acyl carrier protein
MSDPLIQQLKTLIVEALSLDDVKPDDIGDDDPLFGEGLGLDSIDGLELVMTVEKTFQIKIGNSEESRKALHSVAVLAAYIRSQQQAGQP